MIFFEDADGLCCRPPEQIASITPAFPGRFRIVTADAAVGYAYDSKIRTGADMCEYSRGKWVSRSSLRRLEPKRDGLLVTLDSGQTLHITRRKMGAFRSELGLDDYRPQPESLTRIFLREYPFELARASQDVLQKNFADAPSLIANILWQAREFVSSGVDKGYGYTHHGFFYNPLHATLDRGGFLNEDFSKDKAEVTYQAILGRMVAEDRLFDFRSLGFRDKYGHLREIGSARPHVILVIEKEGISDAGIAAARQCGISWIVTGGVARIVSVEFFCAALQAAYQGPVSVVDYGDFDPGGWLNGHVFVKLLGRYDTPCPNGPRYLIRPELFTAEELELFSRPLSSKDGRVDEWLAESGGIGGEPRGIHSDWLQPPERVLRALRAILGEGT